MTPSLEIDEEIDTDTYTAGPIPKTCERAGERTAGDESSRLSKHTRRVLGKSVRAV